MVDLIRSFVGVIPEFNSIYSLPGILEYVFGVGVLLAIMFSLYALLGNIFNLFRR